ncbi:hypothetical protein PInf_011623 [Phytophthora infestans]|nr:hypothetical protein PInf_011623 [Phytophthora infestans]
MASSRPSASSRDLLVGLKSTAKLCATKSRLARASLAEPSLETATNRQATAQFASPSPPPSPLLLSPPSSPQLPSPPSPSSPVGSSAASPASAPSAVSTPPALNTAPLSPLDDASVASDVSGVSLLNRLKELHCGPLFGSKKTRAARTASPAGGCFMDAFRAALYHLGDTGLASTATALWVDFVRDHPSTVDGVSRAEATEFFRVLQRNDFPLDYDLLFQSPPDASYTNVERFQTFVQTLREGVYLTSIGDGLVGHCVTVLAKGPDTTVFVLDGVKLPVTPEPLINLAYLDKVKWMGLMKLNPGYRCRRGKRKSRPNRKKARREKKQQKLWGM